MVKLVAVDDLADFFDFRAVPILVEALTRHRAEVEYISQLIEHLMKPIQISGVCTEFHFVFQPLKHKTGLSIITAGHGSNVAPMRTDVDFGSGETFDLCTAADQSFAASTTSAILSHIFYRYAKSGRTPVAQKLSGIHILRKK